jgi:hypothetical protein
VHIYHPPFITGKTLTLLYPEIAPLLHTVPSHIEDNVRKYDAFAAMDMVNMLRKAQASQADESNLNS